MRGMPSLAPLNSCSCLLDSLSQLHKVQNASRNATGWPQQNGLEGGGTSLYAALIRLQITFPSHQRFLSVTPLLWWSKGLIYDGQEATRAPMTPEIHSPFRTGEKTCGHGSVRPGDVQRLWLDYFDMNRRERRIKGNRPRGVTPIFRNIATDSGAMTLDHSQ